MKNFSQFLKEEISLRGNQGVPDKFISDTDAAAQRELGVRKDDPRQMMQYGPQIMELIARSQQLMSRGLSAQELTERKTRLERLAYDVIMNEYGSILDNVELDIKFARDGNQACQDCEMDEVPAKPKYKKLDDPEIRKEVDKRKIANNIIQGEAKNTKNILHSEMVKDGLAEIFGEEQAKVIFKVWDDTTKVANKMDWIIPIDDKAEMMEMQPGGMAGAVKVEWKPKEVDPSKIINGDSEDENEGEGQGEEESSGDGFTPKITARGIDFPMLLHETVKGIYELLSASQFPSEEDATEEEKKKAELIQLNTSSFEDESEDFRYGPYIAGKLRDYLNKFDGIDRYPNMREWVFGEMMLMPADQFLKLVKDILLDNGDSKDVTKSQIDSVIERLRNYDIDNISSDDDTYMPSQDDEDENVLDPEDDKKDDFIIPSKEKEDKQMSQRDIEKAIDDALDNQDFAEAKRLGEMLNKLYPQK